MAKAMKVIKVCDRCAFGREKPATQTRKYAIDNDWWQIDLCNDHAVMFDRDLGMWTRCSTECDYVAPIRPPAAPTSIFHTEEQKERDRRAAELRARQAPAIRRPTVDTPAPPAKPAPLAPAAWNITPPPVGGDWVLTPHAEQRADERGFDLNDLRAAAARPEQTYNSPRKYGDHTRIHVRGDCAVACDPFNKVVITVMPRGGDHHAWVDTLPERIAQ